MENTFWIISTDINFVKLFKASFKLYVESGMREKVEAAVDIWRNEQGGQRVVTKEFQEKFHKIIIGHCLGKFHCLYLHSTHLIPKYSS
jgi:hypothetical protein